MAYIYKISNNQNKHSYIGQTRIDINQRWREHCRVAINPESPEYNFPLHAAIRKYGKDNFTLEIIEECVDKELDEREIYWIQYFNTYDQGYNASLGGSGHVKYNYDDIVNFYLANNFSIKDTCQYFNIYDQVIYSALKSKNIDYKTLSQKGGKKVGKRIMLVEKNLVFNSMKEIDEYFGKQVHGNIRRCLNGMTKKAYGYTWKELEDNE
jgi:transcriptional/translational regulatory protein YebC/TACO1